MGEVIVPEVGRQAQDRLVVATIKDHLTHNCLELIYHRARFSYDQLDSRLSADTRM
jgi:hypothetical protein